MKHGKVNIVTVLFRQQANKFLKTYNWEIRTPYIQQEIIQFFHLEKISRDLVILVTGLRYQGTVVSFLLNLDNGEIIQLTKNENISTGNFFFILESLISSINLGSNFLSICKGTENVLIMNRKIESKEKIVKIGIEKWHNKNELKE